MLAKSRSDSLARRAALSAPIGYLSRLLLCSGLPRASLLSMVDRLGRLGDSAENKDELYSKLLAPSAASEWDVARVGRQSEIFRKLLWRLSAYLWRYSGLSASEHSNTSKTFLVWLSDVCKKNPAKVKTEKAKAIAGPILSSMSSISSLLATIQNNSILPVSDAGINNGEAGMDELTQFEDLRRPILDIDVNGDTERSFILKCFENDRFNLLDEWLDGFAGKVSADEFRLLEPDTSRSTELAVELLNIYMSLDPAQDGATAIVLKWIPSLSRSTGKPELWEVLFRDVSSNLLARCLSSWSMLHVSQCREWIMALADDNTAGLDYRKVALFLISTSEQPSSQIEVFSESPPAPLQSEWAKSKEFVTSATTVAIKSLIQSREPLERALCRRNSLPSGLTLMLLIARCGKKQLRSVCDLILQQLTSPDLEEACCINLGVVFLRLYLCFPHWMDLGSAAARTVLMNASERQVHIWADWRSSFDEKIDGMIDALGSGGLNATKSLVDLSRKQPLLILRSLPKISALLVSDATIVCDDRRERRGVITGVNLSGNREIMLRGKLVKVVFPHWGYSFAEPLWMAWLDVLLAMPHEVLFTCGTRVGLLQVFEVYLELLSVQLQLMTAHKAARLKLKIEDVFVLFRQFSSEGWSEWLGSTIGEIEVRHILLTCNFITPQEAIDNRRTDG